jgi:hypothetical protein
MLSVLKRLWAQTVWADGAIPPEEWRYRSLKRFWYPLVDVVYVLLGVAAIRYGVPAINHYFPDEYVDFFGWGLMFWAGLALIGVSFYRLWWLEVIAKCALVGQMVTYVAALFSLTRAGDDGRGFVAGVAILAAVVLLMRLSVVAHEWQERKTMRASDSVNHDPWNAAGQQEIRDGREPLG